jgi:hypothetical protein
MNNQFLGFCLPETYYSYLLEQGIRETVEFARKTVFKYCKDQIKKKMQRMVKSSAHKYQTVEWKILKIKGPDVDVELCWSPYKK